MSNRLYLFHRPSEQRVVLAERGSFGWRQVGHASRFLLEVNNMFQRAANWTAQLPNASQDDFVLIMDNAEGAPYAYDHFQWTEDAEGHPHMVLDPVLRWNANADLRDQGLQTLRRTLKVLSDPPAAPVITAGQFAEVSLVERLQDENAELRESARLLQELVDLYRLHTTIEHYEAHFNEPHSERISYGQRRAVVWVKACEWVDAAGRWLLRRA